MRAQKMYHTGQSLCAQNIYLFTITIFSVAVSRSKDVPSFGPPIPKGACFSKCTEMHDWLLTKIINAENAVHRSKKFATMAARTRREALKDLVENYLGPHQNEGASKIASRAYFIWTGRQILY